MHGWRLSITFLCGFFTHFLETVRPMQPSKGKVRGIAEPLGHHRSSLYCAASYIMSSLRQYDPLFVSHDVWDYMRPLPRLLTRAFPRLLQVSSIPCPTCGVPAGKRCERYSGALRKQSHVSRKFATSEAVAIRKLKRRS